jgi:hypothetical protein
LGLLVFGLWNATIQSDKAADWNKETEVWKSKSGEEIQLGTVLKFIATQFTLSSSGFQIFGTLPPNDCVINPEG